MQYFQNKCATHSKRKRQSNQKRETVLWKKEKPPQQEALILRSIAELRDLEGSFSSRCLMERTGIRHVIDRTVRHLLNRNGYFFLQARKKGQRPEWSLPKKCKQNTPQVFGQALSLFTWMVSHSFTRPIHWTKHVPLKGEYREKDLKASH